MQQVHDGERADDGERQRQAGNDGGRHIAQEQENHHHHQAKRQQHGELDVFIRFANCLRAVVQHVHVDRSRDFVAESLDQIPHRIDDVDGVGAGLPLDAENDGALRLLRRVEPGCGLIVLNAVDHVAQFFQAHRRPVAIGHDQRPVLRGGHQLPGGLQRESALRPDDGACRQIDVPVLESRLDFIDADLPRSEQVRIHLHVHGVFLRAQYLHLRHAAHH